MPVYDMTRFGARELNAPRTYHIIIFSTAPDSLMLSTVCLTGDFSACACQPPPCELCMMHEKNRFRSSTLIEPKQSSDCKRSQLHLNFGVGRSSL